MEDKFISSVWDNYYRKCLHANLLFFGYYPSESFWQKVWRIIHHRPCPFVSGLLGSNELPKRGTIHIPQITCLTDDGD